VWIILLLNFETSQVEYVKNNNNKIYFFNRDEVFFFFFFSKGMFHNYILVFLQIYWINREICRLMWDLYKFTVITRRKYFKRLNKYLQLEEEKKYKYTSF
jgi:hypothetical protein